MEQIIRLNALVEVIKTSPGRVNKILIQKEPGPGRISEVVREARVRHIPFVFVPKLKLDQMAPGHQGVLAFLAAREFSSLEEILRLARNPFLVILDEVEDPQNLGAILRSAECAGADGVILPEHRSAGLTDAVLSVSAGAAEHIKICRVVNLARTMGELKERGLWLVGAEAEGDGLWHEFDYTGPVGIVLGSEGRGLRPLVRKTCDRVLSIPLRGKVNSLNVSAAAAVFFFEVVRQRTPKKPA
jgi:23S rRNA (guanosine2251-2'-O)-methyltransferase